MNTSVMIFVGLVFLSVLILMLALFMPVFGENGQSRKKLKARLEKMAEETTTPAAIKLLRDDKLGKLSPLERALETSACLSSIRYFINQSGHQLLAYRFVIFSAASGLLAALITWNVTQLWILVIAAFVGGCFLPFLKINFDRNQRLAKFEEQLPDAIDVMKRALQAGHPFNESLHLVGEELEEPIKSEFSKTFAELNYGGDLKWALLGLLERIQSVNVMALVTAVLVQRETGGNLAEILANLSNIIRGRFRFHRKVRTLSAEGRMSAWILALVPFVMFAMIHFTTPTYLPILVESEIGIQLCVGAFLAMIVGMIWIRKIIRINV